MSSAKPPRKRIPPRTPRQQQNRVARRSDGRVKRSDGLHVDAVVASAAMAVRRAWEEHDDTA